MKKFVPAAIRCSLVFTAVTASLFSIQPIQAYTVRLQQVGSNIVANGSGPINLTGLTFVEHNSMISGVSGTFGIIQTGPSVSEVDRYMGFTGPTSFGLGFFVDADDATGDFVGIRNRVGLSPGLVVPLGYSSGNPLSSSATWNNATFASLGVTPGT
jgi:hypothetical protein